jgi:predicted ABC-type ATPase
MTKQVIAALLATDCGPWMPEWLNLRLKRSKAAGWRIEIVYLRIFSPQLALRRIAARVKQGGHNVPRRDVVRRFTRRWDNFSRHYRLLADAWSVYDNSGRWPNLMERSP